ncbi:MAG: DUF4912 domain-containing protein [Myxococcaceae bacterium]
MTRDDLEQLDTPSLRALARQHLAKGAKAPRTRRALLAALWAKLAPAAAPKPRRRKGTATPGAAVGRLPTSTALAPHAARVAASAPASVARAAPPPADVLVEEGFFVVHAQERRRSRRGGPKPEARRAAAAPAVRALPWGEEVPHLLARDPSTLFLFWDFRRDLERGAAFGLDAPRVLFRLYDGEVLVRTVEAPLGRRSLYLEGLEPAHVYSVEAWLAGSDGHARPTGRRSAPLRLPPAVPSGKLEVQLVRVPWEHPLASGPGREVAGPPGPKPEAVASPARVELPASLDWRGGPGPGGPRSGRP